MSCRVILAFLCALLLTPAAFPAQAAPLFTMQPPSGKIDLETHKGTLIRLPTPAKTVFIADPDIADVQVKSPTMIYLYGKTAGDTVLYAVNGADHVLLASTINVVQDLSGLRRALRTLLPKTPITVTPVGQSVMLSGNVQDAAHAATAMSVAKRMLKRSDVIDHLKVTGANQVNLRVRIAEVSRTVIKDLGFNWTGNFGIGSNSGTGEFSLLNGGRNTFINPGNTPLPLIGSFPTSPSINPAILGPESLAFGQVLGNNSYSGFLDALSNNGLAQVLAEPNLTALSGHSASFLAGGEFPIPVPQGGGSCSTPGNCPPVITIQFKKFGVQLNFKPTIVSPNRISLFVHPEVSELTQTGSITLEGFTIPGIETRQAQTTVELASGQSFAIAGLMQNDSNENIAKYPGLGDLPVLGALFRSNSFQRNQSELVVIVTPYIVRPTSHHRLLAPTDGLVPPNDVERIFGGMHYHREAVGSGFPPPVAVPSGLKGPIGFKLE